MHADLNESLSDMIDDWKAFHSHSSTLNGPKNVHPSVETTTIFETFLSSPLGTGTAETESTRGAKENTIRCPRVDIMDGFHMLWPYHIGLLGGL